MPFEKNCFLQFHETSELTTGIGKHFLLQTDINQSDPKN